jgi:C4-dicarboxylate transporter DctM subunit
MAQAGVGMARVTFLISTAMGLGWILTINQGPQRLAAVIYEISHDRLIGLLMINVLIMIVHTVLEPAATMLVLVPVLMPLLRQLAIDPVFFGIMFVMNSAIGFLLPPVGFCLYIACGVSGARLENVVRAIIPFVIALTVDLILIVLYPQVVLWLPHLVHLH